MSTYTYRYRSGQQSKPFALLDMAIEQARALSKPDSYGDEVDVLKDGTYLVGIARHGTFVFTGLSRNAARYGNG